MKWTKRLNFAKECTRAAFYDVFNRLHCSIELANDDEWGGLEKLCRKAAYLCSRRKKAGDEAIFAGPLLTRSFFAALSLQLTISVRESAPRVSWAHGSFFGLCLAPFCQYPSFWESSNFSLASMKYWMKVVRIVLCDFRMSEKNRVGDISDIWKG